MNQSLRIGHFFADHGIETEPLSAYGDVVRFGLDPTDTEYTSEVHAVDLTDPLPDVGTFDLGLFHPPCYKWTQRSDEDGENLIPRARQIATELCDEYIIENKPDAPLTAPDGGVRIELDGGHFGLPVEYRRAFEVSYPVPTPPRARHWSPEHRVDCTRPKPYWKAVKGYTGDYPSDPLITNALPSIYVHWLVRPMLEGYQYRHSEQQKLVAHTEG